MPLCLEPVTDYKQREKLRVEGEGLASSARAGRGTAVEDAVSRRLGKTWVEKRADACVAERWKEVEELDGHFFRGQEPPPLETRMRELGGIRAIVIGGFCEHGAEVHRLLERAVVAKVRRADTERGEDPRGYGARVREKWR